MNYKILFFVVFLLSVLLISGCSKDTNKANLQQAVFDDGKQVVHIYAQVYNGDTTKENKAWDSAKAFLDKYEQKASLPQKDQVFVSAIKLLQIDYTLYSVGKVAEEKGINSGESSSETKDKIKNLLLQIKNQYGISLE